MRMSFEKEKKPTLQEACDEMSGRIYRAATLFERWEHMGLVGGNGHHAAQKLAQYAVDDLKAWWIGETATE